MKKSKIIVPALAVLLLSTAASVTGTVAWFTANRVFEMKAGQFAVVNTKNNLEAVVVPGQGTQLSGTKDILVSGTNTLTDASVNHNSATPNIVEPDENGTAVGDVYNIFDNASLATNIVRDNTAHIYSAFTWDITFKMTFSTTAANPVGLFFNRNKAWAHEVTTFAADHVIKATEVGDYYSNPDLTGTHFEVRANDVVDDTGKITHGTWYKAVPDDTGLGFRLAFIPKVVPSGSIGYAKTWAPNQESSNCKYIDNSIAEPTEYSDAATYDEGDLVLRTIETVKHYYKAVADIDSAEPFTPAHQSEIPQIATKEATYTATSSLAGATRTKDVAAAALITGTTDEVTGLLPSTQSSACLSGKQGYLGYFGIAAGGVVEMTYTCVAWYEGTDPEIVNTAATIYETVTTNLEFDALPITIG